jgi:aminopeptidase N
VERIQIWKGQGRLWWFQRLNTYLYQSKTTNAPLTRYYYENREDVFDAISYHKGGRILNMLRNYVGDDAFFDALKKYLDDNRFSTGEVHQLRLAFEKVTGEDLNWFFNEWFLSKGHPVLDISYHYDAAAKHETVKISQLQKTGDGIPFSPCRLK